MRRPDTTGKGLILSRASICAGLICIGVVGCSPIRQTHGYIPPDAQVERVEIGKDGRADVQSKIGRPSSAATFDQDEWYYILRTTTTLAFLAPQVEDQRVLVVSFDEDGVVDEVERFGLEDGQVINLVTRTTPTRGQRLTFLQQLLGNVGRFNPIGLPPADGSQ